MTSFRSIKIQNSEQFEYLTDCSSAVPATAESATVLVHCALRKRKQDISFCYLHWNGGKFEKRQSNQNPQIHRRNMYSHEKFDSSFCIRAATAGKVWSLPRFWHSYKKQLVKIFLDRILDLVWLKFAVAALCIT